MTESRRKATTAPSDSEVVLRGIGVSPGVAVGPVFLAGVESEHVVERRISPAEVGHEIARFEDAIVKTRTQIREIQKNVEKQMRHSDVSILDAHLMVLDDRSLIEDVLEGIGKETRNAESILWTVANKYMDALSRVEDDYLRERVADIKDVVRRITRNLGGKTSSVLGELERASIVVAHDLAPSETAQLRKQLVLGFATDFGSPTSHSAMMARALEIPAVVGMHDITKRVSTGDTILMDGNKGVLIIRPTDARLQRYGQVIKERRDIESDLTSLKDQPAQTRGGGSRVALLANIEMPEDVDAVLEYGAEGVGLFRSEYMYMSTTELPTENELARGYEAVANRLAPAPVVIRTLDIGGDKFAPYMGLPAKANPFLGFRSIRICLAEPEMFKTQLRAILRASSSGNVKIMYPMISSTEEVKRANELLEEAKAELFARGIGFKRDIEVGVMIETPSAALTAELIAPHVQFFSLGTNDLVQYTICVDRINEQVAYLYQPTHPAILKLIKRTVEAGHEHGLHVSVCGEMAADPVLCPLLVGFGIDAVSVPPSAVPIVKDAIRSVSADDTVDLVRQAMASESASEVLQHCRKLIERTAPEILELLG